MVFCDKCKWCMPERTFVSLFGLLHDISYEFAKCANQSFARQKYTDSHSEPELSSCSTQNYDGGCPGWEKK